MTDQQTSRTNITEALAAIEHEQWSEWASTLLAQEQGISPERRKRWERLIATPYADLTDAEQHQDRIYAEKVLEALAAEPSEPTGFDLRSNDVRPPRSDAVTAPDNVSTQHRIPGTNLPAVTAPDEPHNESCEGRTWLGSGHGYCQCLCHDAIDRAANEGRNVLPDATDNQASTIEQWAARAASASVPPLDASFLKIALEDWLTYWSGDEDTWEPEMSDGCGPQPCDCGFLALVHQSRLALGRACCGEGEHPGIAPPPRSRGSGDE